jgi:hypothetical protein
MILTLGDQIAPPLHPHRLYLHRRRPQPDDNTRPEARHAAALRVGPIHQCNASRQATPYPACKGAEIRGEGSIGAQTGPFRHAWEALHVASQNHSARSPQR